MANDVTQFDTTALKQRVSDTVQGSFGMLIPEEAFQAMCAAAIKDYFEDKKTFSVVQRSREVKDSPNSYHTRTERYYELEAKYTVFQRLVFDTIHEIVVAQLKAHLAVQEAEIEEQLKTLMNQSVELKGTIADGLSEILRHAAERQLAMALGIATSEVLGKVRSAALSSGNPQFANSLWGN